MSIEEAPSSVTHAVPIYSVEGYVEEPASFIRLYVRDELLEKAYRHLLHKFGYYLLIKHGVIVKNYDPTSGTIRMLKPENTLSLDIWKEFSSFISEYFIPKLRDLMRTKDIDTVLSAFYYRSKKEGNATGLAPVVMLGRHVNQYLNALDNFLIQRSQVGKSIEKIRKTIKDMSNLIEAHQDDIFILEPSGEIALLDNATIVKSMIVLGQELTGKIVTTTSCVYCGSTDHLHRATGKLGVGRIRFAHEIKTKFRDEAKICLRCMLTALFYVLDTGDGETLDIEINGVSSELRVGKVWGDNETERTIKAVLDRLAKPVLTYNALFGNDRLRVRIAGLGEDTVEKLSLLKLCTDRASVDDAMSSIIDFIYNPSLFGSIRSLLQALKQLKKEGGECMSHVSKYLFTRAYIGKEEEWVALTIAKIASGILYAAKERIKQETGEKENVTEIPDKELYHLKTFAEEVRNGSLTKALAYIVERCGAVPIIPVLVPDSEEKEVVKRVLEKYGFKYEEEGYVVKIYADSIPVAEARIRNLYGLKVYEDAHTALTVLNQDILAK